MPALKPKWDDGSPLTYQEPDVREYAHGVTSFKSTYYPDSYDTPYNPDPLYKKGGYELHHEMSEDDQISAVVKFRSMLIVGGEYSIECEDEKICEAAEWALDKIDIRTRLREILKGDVYGFSATEKIPAMVESPFGPMAILKLKTRPPHAWEIHQDKWGDIEFFRYYGDPDIDVKPDRVLHYINEPEFDNAYGNSDLIQGVYDFWWAKKNVKKFLLIYLERYAAGKPIGKYPEGGASPQDKADFDNALKKFSAITSMVIPGGFEVDFMETGKESGAIFQSRHLDVQHVHFSRAFIS